MQGCSFASVRGSKGQIAQCTLNDLLWARVAGGGNPIALVQSVCDIQLAKDFSQKERDGGPYSEILFALIRSSDTHLSMKVGKKCLSKSAFCFINKHEVYWYGESVLFSQARIYVPPRAQQVSETFVVNQRDSTRGPRTLCGLTTMMVMSMSCQPIAPRKYVPLRSLGTGAWRGNRIKSTQVMVGFQGDKYPLYRHGRNYQSYWIAVLTITERWCMILLLGEWGGLWIRWQGKYAY